MALRKSQNLAYFNEPSQQARFRIAFGLPDNETNLIDLNAILGLRGKQEIYSGKLHLSESFLCFVSLDRRSCRLTLPLHCVRRVEKLAPGQYGVNQLEKVVQGVYALSIELYTGSRIVLQLNSLRPTCEQFSEILRQRLKSAVPQMKQLRQMTKTFYSEQLVAEDPKGKGKEKEVETPTSPVVGQLIDVGSAPASKEGIEYTTSGGMGKGWHGGLGLIYKYPGDPRKLRERSKMKLWREYFTSHGRNLTIVRYPAFSRLVQVGLPNRLRGEIWEICSGAVHLRTENTGEYERILAAHEGKTSLSTDEIEKDLNRSLPEYPAYQTAEGIETLRRVLTSYSWKNPVRQTAYVSRAIFTSEQDVGYCQGLNLIVSAFLIYTSEEQCFWLLSILCDRLLPGYYSPSMYGTLLDQKVFEHLVQRCLPLLHEHFAEHDIQLSVVSLPWFMSLFISSMPLIFAFRVVDNFFMMGPKVLFQVALAILRINGEQLLDITDDGMFIHVMRNYFGSLGESAHPNSTDPRLRQVTRFQVLLVTAFREFGIITDETVASERKRFRAEVVESIETFIKRTAIRNLRFTGRMSKEQLSAAHDVFQLALFRSPRSRAVMYRDASGRPESRIDREAFRVLLAELATWAREERVVKNGFVERTERTLAPEHDFVQRVFLLWDTELRGSLSFQDVVMGLEAVLFNDLMDTIAWFLSVHDHDKDGYLTKDEMLQLSESLLFIFRNEPGDQYLAAVSRLMQNAFEYAETVQVESSPLLNGDKHSASDAVHAVKEEEKQLRSRSGSVNSINEHVHRPYISLATFRMVVLADEVLESFFMTDMTSSWSLDSMAEEATPKSAGFFGGLAHTVSELLTDDHKHRLNKLVDDVGKRLDIQTVEQRPSIGKLEPNAALAEPKTRAGLFASVNSPAMSPSASTRMTPAPSSDAAAATALRVPPPTTPAARQARETGPAGITALTDANQLPERQAFVLDAATEDETAHEADADEQTLQEVDEFLKDFDGD